MKKIEPLLQQINKRTKEIYQNSVLEESLGNIKDARRMWHNILNIDVPDGEYYRKAKIKLKKNGG